MSALTLSLREPPPLPVDARALCPGLAAAELRALTLHCNGRPSRVEDWFRISGDDPQRLVLEGDCRRFDGLGSAMAEGELIVDGNAGAWLGAGLRGGAIQVSGDCGDYAGAAMAGGTLRVRGSAGAWLGSAAAGERVGMRDGLIHVSGDAGPHAGDRLRRGIVVIDGDAGEAVAGRMIAGTLVIGGHTGAGLGRGMRRGTVLLHRAPVGLPATFHDGGPRSLNVLALLRGALAALDSPAARFGDRVRRHLGDRAVAGLGEVLVLEEG